MTQQLEPTRRPVAPFEATTGPPVPLPRFERHEVASGTSAPGRAPGMVLAAVAVLVVGIVIGLVAAVLAGTLRLPTDDPAPAVPASVDPAALAVTGRSQLLVAYGELSSAGRTFSDALVAHGGDTRAQQGDCAVHRDAVRRFRTAVADLAFAPTDRARVDTELLPATDRMLTDLDTMVATSSTTRLVQTAGDFDRHGAELDGVVRSIIG